MRQFHSVQTIFICGFVWGTFTGRNKIIFYKWQRKLDDCPRRKIALSGSKFAASENLTWLRQIWPLFSKIIELSPKCCKGFLWGLNFAVSHHWNFIFLAASCLLQFKLIFDPFLTSFGTHYIVDALAMCNSVPANACHTDYKPLYLCLLLSPRISWYVWKRPAILWEKSPAATSKVKVSSA